MARYVNPVPGYEYQGGDQLFFFISNTTTEKDTFADINETILNTNPVICDGDGKVPNVFYTGAARVVCENKDGVQQWERDPVESGSSGGSFSEWSALSIYSENEVVIGSDGEYYRSLVDGNQNNDPVSSPAQWNLVQFMEQWNENISYAINDIVFKDGRFYASLQAGNQNNDPALSPAFWRDKEPVAQGRMTNSTTFEGFGVSSVNTAAVGQHTFTFEDDASALNNQILHITAIGTSGFVFSQNNTAVNTIDVYQMLNGGGAFTNYPIGITRWLVD